MQHYSPRHYWHPLVAGIALGAVLFFAFLITGHGVGASGFFTRLSVEVTNWLVPEWTRGNAYFGPYVRGGAVPLASWITWEIVGVCAGAIVGSVVSHRFHPTVERGKNVGRPRRMFFAFSGGILVGFGARIARGCTSGLGLSGGATLAVAGFLFLIGFFAAGFAVSRLLRKEWQ